MSERAHGFESHLLRSLQIMIMNCRTSLYGTQFGEVPKLAEGTPLERVQVVNRGARVQIPPSPLDYKPRKVIEKNVEKMKKTC